MCYLRIWSLRGEKYFNPHKIGSWYLVLSKVSAEHPRLFYMGLLPGGGGGVGGESLVINVHVNYRATWIQCTWAPLRGGRRGLSIRSRKTGQKIAENHKTGRNSAKTENQIKALTNKALGVSAESLFLLFFFYLYTCFTFRGSFCLPASAPGSKWLRHYPWQHAKSLSFDSLLVDENNWYEFRNSSGLRCAWSAERVYHLQLQVVYVVLRRSRQVSKMPIRNTRCDVETVHYYTV